MKTIWIIRFADDTLESHYGTSESAESIAEKKKDLYGDNYIIEKSSCTANT